MNPMLNQEEVRTAAQAIVKEMTGKKVKDGDSLISSGLIDSLSILRLISSLENKLSVTIPPDNLQPDDFENIDIMTETVLRAAR
jgi:acyl carrier protein